MDVKRIIEEKHLSKKEKEALMKQSLTLESQLCFPMYAASRRIVSLYTPYLKPLGLTYTQYIVFLALWEKDGVTMGELGKKLFLDNGTLTPLLKKLQQSGYLLRERDKNDERVVLISLTEKGKKLKGKVADLPLKIGECVPLNETDAKQLYVLLKKLLHEEQR